MIDPMILLENAIYFLALLNPASKIFFLTAREPVMTTQALRHVSWRATLFAFIILCGSCIGGNFLLAHVFKVQLYALQLSGGLVLLLSGLNAVQKGVFFHFDENHPVSDDELSIVPLAAPLIAGPGTIAATISYSAEFGVLSTLLALIPALLINAWLMIAAQWIARLLEFLVFVGPMIRLTGLIVMAVAAQMMLSGLQGFVAAL